MKPLTAAALAGLGGCLLVGSVVAGTCWGEGLSSGQRVMTDLAMPVGMGWLAAFVATVYQALRGQHAAACGLAMAFIAIWVSFCPLVASLAYRVTEFPPLPQSPVTAEAPRFTALIVLGGGASRNVQGQPELRIAGERLGLAAKMWHAGKVDAIICTGTVKPRRVATSPRDPAVFEPDDPAEVGCEILTALGVPENRVFRSPGQNTAAEMQHLAAFFEHPPAGFPVGDALGLVTSAYHLPRALRLAEPLGLQFSPLPSDSRGKVIKQRGIGIVVPNASAGESIATLAKEWLARVVRR